MQPLLGSRVYECEILMTDIYEKMKPDWGHETSFIGVLIAISASDKDFSHKERAAILTCIQGLPKFRNKSIEDLEELIRTVELKMLNYSSGSPLVLNGELQKACKRIVSEGIQLSVFANCVDIVYADAVVEEAEIEMLEQLIDYLKIGKRHSEKIIDVIMIKNQAP